MGCANAKAAKLEEVESVSKANIQHVEKGRDVALSPAQQLSELEAEEEKTKELAAARIQASQRGQCARKNLSPESSKKAVPAPADGKGTVSLEPCVTVAQARLSFSAESPSMDNPHTPPYSPRSVLNSTSKTQATTSPSSTGTQPSVPASPMLLPTGQVASGLDGEDGVGHGPPETDESPSMPASLLQSNATSPSRQRDAFPSLVDGTAPTDLAHHAVTPVRMIAHFDPSGDKGSKDEKAKDDAKAAQERAQVSTELTPPDDAAMLASALTGRVVQVALATQQLEPSSLKGGSDAEDEAAPTENEWLEAHFKLQRGQSLKRVASGNLKTRGSGGGGGKGGKRKNKGGGGRGSGGGLKTSASASTIVTPQARARGAAR